MRWKIIDFPYGGNCDVSLKERQRLFNEFVTFFGLDRISMPEMVGSYKRLLYGERTYNNTKLGYDHCVRQEYPPRSDHARLYKQQGTNRIIHVDQPYEFNKEELEEWCNERELIYVVCGKEKSFYYPGCTHLILIMSNDTYIELCNIPGFPSEWEVEV